MFQVLYILLLLVATPSIFGYEVELNPSCNPNCHTEIWNAFKSCEKYGRTNCTVSLSPGTYNVFYTINDTYPISCYGIKNVTFRGYGATVISHQTKDVFQFILLEGVVIEGITFDMGRHPHTLGECVSIDASARTITLKIDTDFFPFEYPDNQQYPYLSIAETILGYNHNNDIFEGVDYYYNPGIAVTFNASASTITISVGSSIGGFTVGKWYIVRHKNHGSSHIWMFNVKDVTLKDLTAHSCAGAVIFVTRNTGTWLMDNFQVVRKPGHVVTANADGAHWTMSQGVMEIRNSYWEYLGDDAINIHTDYWSVKEIINATAIVVTVQGQLPAVGDTIQFRKRANFSIVFRTKVAQYNSATFTMVLMDILPPEVTVYDMLEADYHPQITLKNNTVMRNRARGFLVSSSNYTLITNNTFDHPTGISILCLPDFSNWWLGSTIRTLRIIGNTFIGGNYAMAKGNADILVGAEVQKLDNNGVPTNTKISLTGTIIHYDIEIADNIFTQDQGQGAVEITLTDGVTIRNNVIKYSSAKIPQVNNFVSNSTNVTLSGNLCYKDDALVSCVELPTESIMTIESSSTVDTENVDSSTFDSFTLETTQASSDQTSQSLSESINDESQTDASSRSLTNFSMTLVLCASAFLYLF